MDRLFAEYVIASLVSGGLLLGGLLFVVWKMLGAENRRREVELLIENRRITLALRLQAYERLMLMLERISPETLAMHLQQNCPTNAALHNALTSAVRSEFEHNISQQIYISQSVWQSVVMAKNNVIRSINTIAMETEPANPSIQLAQRILNEYVQNPSPVQPATVMLKKEAAKLF